MSLLHHFSSIVQGSFTFFPPPLANFNVKYVSREKQFQLQRKNDSGGVMKIFIPMANADLPLDDEITGKLVPFDPSFLKPKTASSDGFKPRNWVSESTREQAQNRLLASQG